MEIENISTIYINNLQNSVIKSEIKRKLNLDSCVNANGNYEILSKIITESMKKHISKKKLKFDKRKHKKEKWMTDNLLSLVNQKMICIEIGNQKTMLMSMQRKRLLRKL